MDRNGVLMAEIDTALSGENAAYLESLLEKEAGPSIPPALGG